MLIDNIIEAKTKYKPDKFTGGNIQFSVSKYTQTLTIKLVLYFGYDLNRNTISRQIEILEKDVDIVSSELLIKAKEYRDKLLLEKESSTLDLDEFVNIRTNVVRGRSSDNDRVDSDRVDRVDSDRDTIQSEQAPHVSIPNKKEILETWNENAKKLGIPLLRNISDARYKKFKTRVNKSSSFLDDFLEALEIASESKFIMEGSWFSFDWLIANDENYLKVLEGNYSKDTK